MRKLLSFSLLAVLLVWCTGCRFLRDVTSGFTVNTRQTIVTSRGDVIQDAPLPNTPVAGQWLGDVSPSAAGFVFHYGVPPVPVRTNEFGKFTVFFGRTNANWDLQALCFNRFVDELFLTVFPFNSIKHRCGINVGSLPFSSSRFEIAGATPATLTLGGQNFTSQNGMPLLYVYNRNSDIVAKITATALSADATVATFPFPTQQTGAALPSDVYGMAIVNWDTPTQTYCEPMYDEWGNYIGDYCWQVPGDLRFAGANYIGIGGSTSLTTPFGVDATATNVQGTECYSDPYGAPDYQTRSTGSCTSWNYTTHDPIVTLSAPGQVYYRGSVLGVGSSPTAIRVYWTDTSTQTWVDPFYYYQETTSQPSRALVVNSGSNSVSVVDLIGWQVIATISVGSRPTAVLITPDESKAYVTNYDSSSVTEINLYTNSVTRTVGVGYGPTALSLDPAGTGLWVGGQGWLSKIDMSSFSALATYPVNGTITSMATSAAENSIIYTAVANGAAPESTYAAAITYPGSIYSVRKLRLTDMSTVTSSSAGSGSAYQYAAASASLPTPSLLAGGTRVSVNYGNGISVSATPDGFVVIDVGAGTEIMRGRTPTPVRAIAADPAEGVVYLTVPDSNMLIRVPLQST